MKAKKQNDRHLGKRHVEFEEEEVDQDLVLADGGDA